MRSREREISIPQCTACGYGIFKSSEGSARMTSDGLMCGQCYSTAKAKERLSGFPRHLMPPEATAKRPVGKRERA